jgi:nitrogen-specific signal transduction histidine kinase
MAGHLENDLVLAYNTCRGFRKLLKPCAIRTSMARTRLKELFMGVLSPTYFAPPEREQENVLLRQYESLAADPFVDRLLDSLPEPTMILNSRRQIVRANEQTAKLLGMSRDRLRGLRLGEAIQCPRAQESPAGCGTTTGCRYCGAVRAIMNCQTAHLADTQECRVESWLTGEPVSLDLRVSAAPFPYAGDEFTVCSLRDITDEKRRQVLERIFFHDILNTAGSLKAMMELLDQLHGEEEKAVREAIGNLSGQIVEEVQSQRDLVAAEAGELAVKILDVNVSELLDRICALYRRHSVAFEKSIVLSPLREQPVIWTDEVLLGRVLGNLIKNALEASRPGEAVTVAFENKRQPVFSIHNPSLMPESVQLQIFQRSFSTREGRGRGIGCYSVKLLTEKYLRGKVWFVSRKPEGTTFFVALPPPSQDVLSRAFVY